MPPFWDRDLHAARRPRLIARGALRRAIAAHFADRGFIEVETATLAISPGNETHIHAFSTTERRLDGGTRELHLITSPEFQLKKLLSAGETKPFEFARVFRNREAGPINVPEFTMLEWYRAGEGIDALVEDVEALLALAAGVGGLPTWSHRGRVCDPTAAPERLTLSEAFARHAGIDLDRHLDDPRGFAAAVRAAGLDTAADDGWSDLFARVVSARIEPALGIGRPTVLERYPASEAALARLCPDDPRFAERFEVYVCGVELANGFGELTDPAEQRARFEADMAEKERLYGERYPIDEDFLAALGHMPPASGIALGFDRLVMLATGAERVDDVLFTPLPAP